MPIESKRFRGFLLGVCGWTFLCAATSAEPPDISSVKPDLETPKMIEAAPAPGLRVKQQIPDYADTGVYHALYLPADWTKDAKFPIIVEYAGNGGYKNKFNDVSGGRPEGSNLGYGISAGKRFIWICMPYVNSKDKTIQTNWWGDVDATCDYCRKAVQLICEKWGGDPSAVFLAGFSRGAIACGYIGLHDDSIARLWVGFIPYSHYDGVKTWNYPESDAASARKRLQRLNGRPTFVCQEGTIDATRAYIESTGVQASFTFMTTGFRNHNDAWTLRESETRTKLRQWVDDVLRDRPGKTGAK